MLEILNELKYDDKGLIPAITQDVRTDEVLMMAWMNRESLQKTIETGRAHYYSRSRQSLWLKGETSGHFQNVKSISYDCDSDTLLLKVEQVGAACHTGHRSCFYRKFEAGSFKTAENDNGVTGVQTGAAALQTHSNGPEVDSPWPAAVDSEVLKEVFYTIKDRLVHPKEGSYTNYLFAKGLDKILKKIGEESAEVVIASKNGDRAEIKAEISDLFYHIMVLLVERGMTLEDVYGELKERR